MKTKHVFAALTAMIILCSGTNLQQPDNYRIVVGIAYADLKCGGITVKTVKGYEYKYARSGKLDALVAEVKNAVAEKFNMNKEEVVTIPGTTSNMVLIRYQKKVPGWNCEKKLYAVGFGYTYASALDSAVRKMETKASYDVVTNVAL